MNKAEQSGENPHLAVLAYSHTIRSREAQPNRGTDSMYIQSIAIHQMVSVFPADQMQTDHASAKTGITLQLHNIATLRTPTIPASLSTTRC